MAINAYVGLQGSGKSYEVVSSVIVEAVANGRRVVTNVDGINQERIREYLINERQADADKLGAIIHVTNQRILEPQFFPDEEKPDLDSVVKGGDMVAVDEAWRFWGNKLSHEHMQFFRMHRHYVHAETAVACDVVLMTQDITCLHRDLKNVVEFVFRMQKHKSLGLNKRYRVELYEGWKLNSKTRIDTYQKAYDRKIFPLYQSYTGGKGQEKAIDKRQNILANKTLWYYAGGVVLMMSISGWGAWRFFHPTSASDNKAAAAPAGVLPTAGAANAGTVPVTSAKAVKPNFSDEWRMIGEYESNGERWIVVKNGVGRLRVESPSMFHGEGMAVLGEIDGDKVTRWSGSQEEKGPVVAAPGMSK